MLLNRNTGILVYFSVVTDNAAHETLYKMKVFVYAKLLCFLFRKLFANTVMPSLLG